MTKVIAVTGCLGFLGRHFVDYLLENTQYVYGIDAETYAADKELPNSQAWLLHSREGRLHYVNADIVTLKHLPDIDAVVNFAAETHVDNSIMDSRRFIESNVLGVQNLLELVRAKRNYEMPRFIQISTDEVYGDVRTGTTDETAPLYPSSPYAASKAAADFLVQAYARTYGIPFNIIRPSNCYGPHQYPEKLIPKAVRYFTLGKRMSVHDDGSQTRSWLDVRDCARAVGAVLDRGQPNAIYNIAGNTHASVLEIVETIVGDRRQMCFGVERQGIDERYAVSDAPLRALGWVPSGDLWRDLGAIRAAEQARFRW